MTRSRYSKKESYNRLVRLFEGHPLTSDTPDVIPGEVLSEDEAWSDLAELFEGSLPDQDFELPSSWVATVAQANADTATVNTKAITPASHQWAHEYGGIYTSTGTVVGANHILASQTWVKITGAFKSYTLNSGGEVDCDWNDDRIVVNEVGTYLVQYSISLLNRGDAVTVDMMAYANALPQRQTRSSIAFGASGTVDGSKMLVGLNPVAVAASGTAISLYAYASAATTVQLAAGQLFVQRMVG
jgi:hypothetical protein